jgi:hypothetical protein
MKEKTEKERKTMTYEKNYDVIVLGGGFTGCAAALAAARQGQKTLLLEASGFLGGAVSNCLIFPLMPYATTVKDENGEPKRHYLSRGILAELVKDLQETGDIRGDSGFLDEAVKLLLDRKMIENGVQVLFHATLCGVTKDGNHITSVDVVTKAGVLTFCGKMFVDCTGDADLCVMSGVPTVLGREPDHLCQPMTLCFRVANVDKKAFYANREEMNRLHKEWLDAGRFTNPRENILVFDYPIDGILHFNTTRVVKKSPIDPFDLTAAEIVLLVRRRDADAATVHIKKLPEIMPFAGKGIAAGIFKIMNGVDTIHRQIALRMEGLKGHGDTSGPCEYR